MSLSVLYIGTLPPHQGGSAVMAAQLLEGLASAGHRVRAIAQITPEHSADGCKTAAAPPGVEVDRYTVPYFDTSPDVDRPSSYRELERRGIEELGEPAIRRAAPDVLIAGRESFAWHVSPLAARHGLPHVLLVQGGTTIGLLRGTYASESAQALLDRIGRADAVVVVANHLVRPLEELGIPDVQAVPNPVDLERFAPRPRDPALTEALDIRETDIVVAHLSNMKRLKRPLDLVHSAEQALRANPSLLYLIVGDGPLRGEVQASCAARGLSGRFRFVDWVEHEVVPDYLSLADLVVMPSEGEAQALVYLETQASGRTLIASDIPGALEVVTHGETGIIFRTADILDLTEKTLLAAGDPALRAQIGERARERVVAHSLERVVARYEAILEEVVERRRAADAGSTSAAR